MGGLSAVEDAAADGHRFVRDPPFPGVSRVFPLSEHERDVGDGL